MQRVEQPIMTTGLERIAAKAREDRKLKFTSLAHHVTEELVWESVCHIPTNSAPGCDEQTVTEAKETFKQWAPEMLRAIHQQGYRPPPVLRVFIPKPGKKEKRPLGIPCVADRALQRSVAGVLAAIYEQDFLPCSFGGRPGLGAHHALATLTEVIAGKPVSYVYEADLKNFFGSLDHGWLLRFLENRVGDPRITSLIRRWLKAGILEDGELTTNEKGTPQGGSTSVLLSNLYLHHVLDLWFEKVVKPRLKGQAYLIRYIDDFVICFQYREDAERVQAVLGKRLDKFALALEPSKTKLIEFGRFAQRDARAQGRRPETLCFSGVYALLHAQSQGQLQGRSEDGEVSASPQSGKSDDAHAQHSSLVAEGPKGTAQSGPAGPLRILWIGGEREIHAQAPPRRGTLLAQDALHP
ncbi:MAG: polymerase [Gammaproteobacteria bacterium]|nr:polymerase [Gammaproteobacteria bacterium]